MSNMVKIPERRIKGRRAGDPKTKTQIKIPQVVKAEVYSKAKGKCFCCGEKLNWNASYDHFIPRSLGGSNKPDNIFLCCRSTNSFFGNKSPGEKMRMILESPYRKLDCNSISEIMKIPTEQQPVTKDTKENG